MFVSNELTNASFSHPITRYLFATRPHFLLATLAACLLGQFSALHSGVAIDFMTAFLTVLLALLLHAAVNVLNDYFDSNNGTDSLNSSRIYPFTGGSRFIQNGILTAVQMRNYGYLLLGGVVLGGLIFAIKVGFGLLWIGMFGVLLGWAYSASPLQLNARGLGEVCVLLGFLGVVVGADYVQSQAFSIMPIVVGLSYALLVTNLLFINQFPDRAADAIAQKNTIVVRFPLSIVVWVYALIAILVCFWVCCMVIMRHLPWQALGALLPLIYSYKAFLCLKQHADSPSQLTPALQLTLASMLGHALLLLIILFWTA
jgi:1,4-dihydroxy-2-naphthoate octaprenyltransferase